MPLTGLLPDHLLLFFATYWGWSGSDFDAARGNELVWDLMDALTNPGEGSDGVARDGQQVG